MGYIAQSAFFGALGAPWLMREVTVGELAFSSLPVTLLILTMTLYTRFVLLPRAPQQVHPFAAQCFLLIGIVFVVAAISACIFWQPSMVRIFGSSSVFDALVVGMLFSGSGTMAQAIIYDWRFNQPRKLKSWWLIAVTIAVICVGVSPAIIGAREGGMCLAAPEREFPCVELRGAVSPGCLPVVYFGGERVYCLAMPLKAGNRQIIVVQWQEIRSVHPRPH
jgi:hypothetical protein